jgi:hypothetical protein
MNLRRFALIDSVLLDVAGVAALIAGEVTLGVLLLGLAAAAFAAFVVLGRRDPVALSR